jgi:MFS family permease
VIVGLLLGLGSAALSWTTTPAWAFAAGALFGFGVGGLLSTLPLAWADYFGRRGFGAIRGMALSIQVSAQALGPVLSGLLRDLTAGYETSLIVFCALGGASAVAALFARPPAWTGRR